MTLTEILLTDRTTGEIYDVDVRRTLPRHLKPKAEQTGRTKAKAEVFTPSWVCNMQNNLIDGAWFGRDGVFNTEGDKSWTANRDKVTFPDGKHWSDYVTDTRLEITCGEAPYLTSRYDTVSGACIAVPDRIGILDRKLRVVTENSPTPLEWMMAMMEAVKNTYGFEWQKDSVWLARRNIVQTVKEHFRHRFRRPMPPKWVEMVAYVASWNIWRMDGIRNTIPGSCSPGCRGCGNRKKPLDAIHLHDGIYAKVKDWNNDKEIEFRELFDGIFRPKKK